MARPSLPCLLAAALLVAGAIPLGFIWILTSAKFEIGGASFGESTVGKVENIDQRAMEQFCTGVRATPAGTWLVGRREVGRDEQALPEGVIDLDLVAAAQPREEESEPHLFNFLNGMLLSGGDPETTYVSRLGATACSTKWRGSARPPAWKSRRTVPASSCSPACGAGKDNGQRERTVVLRSDDQGKSWRRLEEASWPRRIDWAGLSHRASTARTKSGSGVISNTAVPMAAGNPASRAGCSIRPTAAPASSRSPPPRRCWSTSPTPASWRRTASAGAITTASTGRSRHTSPNWTRSAPRSG